MSRKAARKPAEELPGPSPGDPYCANCGYPLSGLIDSSKCPECGQPLVDVLVRGPMRGIRGRRYTSPYALFGLPVLSIAQGPRPDLGERYGKAKGIIAIGDSAVGGVALGGRAVGVVAVGGLALGGVSLGGASVGLLGAIGGWAIGGLAAGGGSVGGLAVGGGAAGIVAKGGGAAGLYAAAGGGAVAPHVIDRSAQDPVAQQVFTDLGWFFGPPSLRPGIASILQPAAVILGLALILAGVISVIALRASRSGATHG